ncbi:RepB family plasmid replication initiator protein, partial [Acinetobacter baumannii]
MPYVAMVSGTIRRHLPCNKTTFTLQKKTFKDDIYLAKDDIFYYCRLNDIKYLCVMKELIVKDNALINASYNLDLVEQRLILLAIVEAR